MSTVNLNKVIEKEIDRHLTNRAMLMLEACIGIFLDTRSPEQVATILEQQANNLRNWG